MLCPKCFRELVHERFEPYDRSCWRTVCDHCGWQLQTIRLAVVMKKSVARQLLRDRRLRKKRKRAVVA